MSLMAFVAPILPGKLDRWKQFASELDGPRRKEYEESRRREHLRERAFLQSTPQGDMVIVTLEGDDPAESFRRLVTHDDPFTRWFAQQVKEIHGLDLAQVINQPLPELWLDSESGAAQQRRAA